MEESLSRFIPELRCVNIDWLEVYVEESNNRFPCNADYFREAGYMVKERDYGTRQYAEMFVILDEHDVPIIEVRRNPKAGESSFSGLNPLSSHIRLTNYACYQDGCVQMLRDFLLKHDYTFKRIFRIDICYDFEKFDTGDLPARFARRYVTKKYTKINQCRVAAYGADNWSSFDWETLSWGSRSSMVSTKLYNKTKELASHGWDKTYIVWDWFTCGLLTDPVNRLNVDADGHTYQPDIWRIEFSLKSSVDNWIVIENQSGKRPRKTAVRHTLSMFDSRDKLWQRFEDLAQHYFRFKVYQKGTRKDRCPDKQLFYFNMNRPVWKAGPLPQPAKQNRDDDILWKRLQMYALKHSDPKLREACEIVLHALKDEETRRIAPLRNMMERTALQKTIAQKMAGDERSAIEIMAEIMELLEKDMIW